MSQGSLYSRWLDEASDTDWDRDAKHILWLMRQLSSRKRSDLTMDADQLRDIVEDPHIHLLTVNVRQHNQSRIVGMGTLVVFETTMHATGLVEDVVVDRRYRGQGIGRNIVEQLVRQARGIGLDYIELTSSPRRKRANRLYKGLGFKNRTTNVYRLKMR